MNTIYSNSSSTSKDPLEESVLEKEKAEFSFSSKYSRRNLVQPFLNSNAAHVPTYDEMVNIIDHLTNTIILSDALCEIPEDLQKESKTLSKINSYVLKLNDKKPQVRRRFAINLYLHVKKSTQAIKYFSKCVVLNEIRGAYYLGKMYSELKHQNKPSKKRLAYAAKALYEEDINIVNNAALKNLQNYLCLKGYIGTVNG